MKHEPRYALEETTYGFKWGPAEITRCISGPFGVLLEITSKKEVINVRITPSGLIRLDEEVRKVK